MARCAKKLKQSADEAGEQRSAMLREYTAATVTLLRTSADHQGLPDRASLEKDADFSAVTPSPECQEMLDELGK